MTAQALVEKLRASLSQALPLPAAGETAKRHRLLMEMGRDDLSYARLAEAHWDAVAILAEAGRVARDGAIYGVWASEIPGKALTLEAASDGGFVLNGSKMFCSGGGLVDRALVTTVGGQLVDVDVDAGVDGVSFDDSQWKTAAFAETHTSTATFAKVVVSQDDFVGVECFYLERPGFWHGACGPAACWAGGAAGLIDYAVRQKRDDAHTLAHLGAMRAALWAMESYLETAGREIDADPEDRAAAQVRAISVRHLVEQASTEILRRLGRGYGPHPLAFNAEISRRCHELELYLRQSHAERDLESLGRLVYGAASGLAT